MERLSLAFILSLVFGAGTDDREPSGLVADLGHPLWSRRETAEKELLVHGNEVIEELRKALRSDNPERARRARYVLDHIDPAICVVDVATIELDETPRVAEIARFSGEDAATPVRSGKAPAVYQLSWELTTEPFAEITIGNRTSPRAGATRRFRGPSPAAHVYEIGSESRYLRSGRVLDRQRYSYLTIVHHRQGRRSRMEADPQVPETNDFLESTLVPTLLHQVRSDDISLRLTALAALGRLRIEKAQEHFEAALEHPKTFAAGTVGLGLLRKPGATALLLEALRKVDGRRPPGPDAHSWKPRAAELLARRREAPGIEYLLEELEGKNPLKQYRILPPLSDAASWIGEVASLRDRFLDTALRRDVILEAWWRDPEFEYFVFRCLDLLDPRSSKDASLAAQAESALEELAGGRSALNRVPLRRIFPLWRKATAIASGTGRVPDLELPLFERALEDLGNRSSLAGVVNEIVLAFAGTPLPPPLFEKLVERFRVELSTTGPARLSGPARHLLHLSGSLSIDEGQLAPWVTLLCDWAEIPNGSLSLAAAKRRLEGEVERWTGLDARSYTETSGDRRASPPAPSENSAGEPSVMRAREWLADEERVKEREERLIAERSAERDGSSGSVVYYEFDLALDKADGGLRGVREIIDGRRLEIELGVECFYRGDGGNRHRVFIEPVASEDGNRYRLNESRILFERAPLLHGGAGRKPRDEWYRTSNLLPRGRSITRKPSNVGYRTVSMVVGRTEDTLHPSRKGPGLDEGAPFVGEVEPLQDPEGSHPVPVDERWKEFVEHLLDPPDSLEPGQLTAYLRTLDQLRLPRTAEILAKLSSRASPSVDSSVRRTIARRLIAHGDNAGREVLLRMVQSDTFRDRLVAAQELSSLGIEEGLRALVKLAGDIPAGSRGFSRKRQILTSLLRYFRPREGRGRPETEASLERDAIAVALESIEDTRLQTLAFSLIERLAGTDFGFREAYRTRGPGRRAAIRAAVKKAHDWAGQLVR